MSAVRASSTTTSTFALFPGGGTAKEMAKMRGKMIIHVGLIAEPWIFEVEAKNTV